MDPGFYFLLTLFLAFTALMILHSMLLRAVERDIRKAWAEYEAVRQKSLEDYLHFLRELNKAQ